MKMKILFPSLVCLLSFDLSYAQKDCAAQAPTRSIDSKSEMITDYESAYDEDNQISFEVFKLKNVGEVAVIFEACEHLNWKVIFLTPESFTPLLSQERRLDLASAKIKLIPLIEKSRLAEFVSRFSSHRDYATLSELNESQRFWVLKEDEQTFTHLLFEEKPKDSGSRLHLEIDVAI
jgi:hypothetical protein